MGRAGLFGLTLLGLACQQTEGQAVVRCVADDDEGWPGCGGLEHTFDFEADFFALQRSEDLYDIRLQQGGKGVEIAEGFQIQVMSAVEARECRLQAIDLEAPTASAASPGTYPACRSGLGCLSPSECPLVRVVAHFPRTCPPGAPALVGGDAPGGSEGSTSHISFVALGGRPGDTVSGSFDMRVANGRTGETAGRCSTLDDGFSFVVKEGQPYVRFVD